MAYAYIEIGGAEHDNAKIETDIDIGGTSSRIVGRRRDYTTKKITGGNGQTDIDLFYSDTQLDLTHKELLIESWDASITEHNTFIRSAGRWTTIPMLHFFQTLNAVGANQNLVDNWTFRLRCKAIPLLLESAYCYWKVIMYKNSTLLFASGSTKITSTSYLNYVKIRSPSGSIISSDKLSAQISMGYFDATPP